MDPRTAPDPARIGIRQKAIDELKQWGPMKAYKEAMLAATDFWQDEALVFGLPSHWEHRGIVTVYAGNNQSDWRVYVERWKNIRMGLAESLDGGALLLLMLMPTDLMSLSQATMEARKRI